MRDRHIILYRFSDQRGNEAPMSSQLERIEILSREQWRSWLSAHHEQITSVWVMTHKRAAGAHYVPYEEMVEEALCYGWIDSTRRGIDDQRMEQLFTPRKARSKWSALNKRRIERLIAEGRMAPSGMAKIDQARRDGSWSRFDDSENLVVPSDLTEALSSQPEAEAYFTAFPPSSHRIILEWILSAKRPETRAKRIEETVRLAALNERAHHPKPR